MDARFRVRTRDERELAPATLDAFFEMVRSGEIDRDDLVHDTLTGEWAPAWAHPVYKLVMDPLVEKEPGDEAGSEAAASAAAGDAASRGGDADGAAAGEAPSPDSDDSGEAEGGGGDGLGLRMDLVDKEVPDADAAAAEFVRKMREEREAEAGLPGLVQDVPLVDPKTGVVEGLAPEPPDPGPAPFVRKVKRTDPTPSRAPHTETPPVRGSVTAPERTRRGRRSRWLWWLGLAGALGLAFALGSTVARASFRVTETLPDRDTRPAVRGPRSVSDGEERVRADAWQGFVARVDRKRAEAGLHRVPGDWLEGHYLAQASVHSEVRRFWEAFLRYAETVHTTELDLYRAAYLEAMDASRVRGPVRSMRLATAVADFTARALERDDHYARVWELAVASLDLHDLLVEMEEEVSFEPVTGGRISADPVIEAAGTDESSQERLDAALDRVLRALQQVGAERGAREEVPRWLAAGLAMREPGD